MAVVGQAVAGVVELVEVIAGGLGEGGGEGRQAVDVAGGDLPVEVAPPER